MPNSAAAAAAAAVVPSGWCGPTIIAVVFYVIGALLEIGDVIARLVRQEPIPVSNFVYSFLVYTGISAFWILIYYLLCANGMAWLSWTILVIKLLLGFFVLLMVLALLVIAIENQKKISPLGLNNPENRALAAGDRASHRAMDLARTHGTPNYDMPPEGFAVLPYTSRRETPDVPGWSGKSLGEPFASRTRSPSDQTEEFQFFQQQISDSNL